jgi:selenocysteine lyase/cysteine desulfurase
VLALNEHLTTRLEHASFEVLSPGGEHRSGQTLVGVVEPAQAVAFLRERRIQVTEKPEGVRISTHFYNNEAEIDLCVDALVAYRDQFLP